MASVGAHAVTRGRVLHLPRRTRYQPMRTPSGTVLISADRRRALDAEALVERLPDAFIRSIRLMSDDEIALLALLAKGLQWASDAEQADLVRVAARRGTRRGSAR